MQSLIACFSLQYIVGHATGKRGRKNKSYV